MRPLVDKSKHDLSGFSDGIPVCDANDASEIASLIHQTLAPTQRPQTFLSAHFSRAYKRFTGKRMQSHDEALKYNRHLNWAPIKSILARSTLVEAVKEILGPNLIIWRSNIFYQFATQWDSLPWHRDHYPEILSDSTAQVSVQIALTESSRENCLQVLPGSQLLNEQALYEQFGFSVSTRSQVAGTIRFSVPAEPESAFSVVLAPGCAAIFHPGLLHRSSVNTTRAKPTLRVSLTVRFATADNRVRKRGVMEPCVLVAGEAPEGINEIIDWRRDIH